LLYFNGDRRQAQLTDAQLKGVGSDGGKNHVDVLEDNLKRQLQETETLRHDVLVQKLELEKQTAALNHLIASIHAEQRHGATSDALADDTHTPLGDGGRSLSPIKRVPSDGDDAKSPLNSLEEDEDCDSSEASSQKDTDGDGSSGEDSDDGCRARHRLLSIVAEVDGEDESLYEQKVSDLVHAARWGTAQVCCRSYCRCYTPVKVLRSDCNLRQLKSSDRTTKHQNEPWLQVFRQHTQRCNNTLLPRRLPQRSAPLRRLLPPRGLHWRLLLPRRPLTKQGLRRRRQERLLQRNGQRKRLQLPRKPP
jgi:hypothetical protein